MWAGMWARRREGAHATTRTACLLPVHPILRGAGARQRRQTTGAGCCTCSRVAAPARVCAAVAAGYWVLLATRRGSAVNSSQPGARFSIAVYVRMCVCVYLCGCVIGREGARGAR